MALDFTSPTKGKMTFEEAFQDIISFMKDRPEFNYSLIIGTDSQPGDQVTMVTALVIYREGKGGRYYYRKEAGRSYESFRQRIFHEASRSLEVGSMIVGKLSENGYADLNVEIHLDVGENGKTKELIRQVVGMVVGSGFDAKIKPDSYGASKVADKHAR